MTLDHKGRGVNRGAATRQPLEDRLFFSTMALGELSPGKIPVTGGHDFIVRRLLFIVILPHTPTYRPRREAAVRSSLPFYKNDRRTTPWILPTILPALPSSSR